MRSRILNLCLAGAAIVVLCSASWNVFFPVNSTVTGKKSIAYDTPIKETLVCDSAGIIEVLQDNILLEYAYHKLYENLEEMMDTTMHSPRVTKPYTISAEGIALLKKFESCRLDAYQLKGEQYLTIGYGHQIYPGDKTPHHITQKQADDLFARDLKKYTKYAEELIDGLDSRFPVTQGFVDGMVSLVYNCGKSGVRGTKFYARLKACRFDANGNINKQDLAYALETVKVTKVSWPGHKPRRQQEYALMTK